MKLLELRRQMAAKFVEGGWLREGTDPMDLLAADGAQCTEGDPEYIGVYNECYKLPAFHSIAHQPEILGMISKLCGGPALSHPQKVIRLWFPKYVAHTTPMHQVRGGGGGGRPCPMALRRLSRIVGLTLLPLATSFRSDRNAVGPCARWPI